MNSRRERAAREAGGTLGPAAPARSTPMDPPRGAEGPLVIAGVLLSLVVVIGAFVWLELTPYLGRGVARLLPTPAAQRVAALVLLGAQALLVVRLLRGPGGERRPPLLVGPALACLIIVSFVLAPTGRRGQTGPSGAAVSIAPMQQVLYSAFLLVALVAILRAVLPRRLTGALSRLVLRRPARSDEPRPRGQAAPLLRDDPSRARRQAALALGGSLSILSVLVLLGL